jgi:anti-sigma factor RsiW
MDPANDAHVRMLSWRSIMPIAAAAAVVMVWAASAKNRTTDVASQGLVHNNADMTSPASVEKLLEDLVANHEKSVTQSDDQALLPQLEPEVGVPVKMPNFKPFGARWEGLSVVPVSNQRAASLRYRLAGHKLTVYIYDASRVPVRSTLQQRLVRNEPVYVGSRHGVSIAATERFNGVGYAVATDLNKDESAELVASIHWAVGLGLLTTAAPPLRGSAAAVKAPFSRATSCTAFFESLLSSSSPRAARSGP